MERSSVGLQIDLSPTANAESLSLYGEEHVQDAGASPAAIIEALYAAGRAIR